VNAITLLSLLQEVVALPNNELQHRALTKGSPHTPIIAARSRGTSQLRAATSRALTKGSPCVRCTAAYKAAQQLAGGGSLPPTAHLLASPVAVVVSGYGPRPTSLPPRRRRTCHISPL